MAKRKSGEERKEQLKFLLENKKFKSADLLAQLMGLKRSTIMAYACQLKRKGQIAYYRVYQRPGYILYLGWITSSEKTIKAP
jgi:biotin operon repressor